jgi:sugar phosphate isomerase/epimerase
MKKRTETLHGCTRREFGKLGLAVVPALGLAGLPTPVGALFAQGRPNSVFGGVPIGMIGNLGTGATDPASLAATVAQIGLSSVELGNGPVEAFAGAPAALGRAGGAGGRAGAPAGGPPPAGTAGAPAQPGRGAGRAALTPEQQAAQRAHADALRAWRGTVPMDRVAAFRKIYNDAGIRIHAFRMTLTAELSDAEYDYAFTMAKALGASQVSMELPDDAAIAKRIGTFAAKHQVLTGYHTHLQATPTIFDEPIAQSSHNGIQLDIGHYVAATSQSPIPLMERHHARIASLHLKDRKANGGPNMPWGQGDTPLREVLQLMKRRGFTFPAFIELEYPVPEGSTRVAEITRCLEYCRAALT